MPSQIKSVMHVYTTRSCTVISSFSRLYVYVYIILKFGKLHTLTSEPLVCCHRAVANVCSRIQLYAQHSHQWLHLQKKFIPSEYSYYAISNHHTCPCHYQLDLFQYSYITLLLLRWAISACTARNGTRKDINRNSSKLRLFRWCGQEVDMYCDMNLIKLWPRYTSTN